MKRAAVSLSIAMGLGMLLLGEYPNGLATSLLAVDAHAYFRALVAEPAHYKSYSLRSQQQLDLYRNSKSLPSAVTYGPADDTYTKPQDAAKVTIPPFRASYYLVSSVGSDDTTVTLSGKSGDHNAGASFRIDSEVMKIVSVSGLVFKVERGAFGTSRAPHAANTRTAMNNFSLLNQVWLPMGTEDGHSYVTTWDAWYSEEIARRLSGIDYWKTYQFRRIPSASGPAVWFEVRTRFDLGSGDNLAAVDVRGYGGLGPNITKDQPLSPQAATFMVKAETWTRYWMEIEQRAGAWDVMSLWVADETRGPVKIIDRLLMETFNSASGQGTIHSFQLEFNTSLSRMSVLHGDLVAYVRNVVMLKDYGDPSSLLVRPVAGDTPAPRLGAPKNVRIVGS